MHNIEIRGIRPSNLDDITIENIVVSGLKILDIAGCSLEIDFVSKPRIQVLNKKFRSIDKPTDVLSFPQENVPGQEIRVLGNLVIASKVVVEKDEDIKDVIKHGLLHLLGYDHESDKAGWGRAASKIICKL